ncbi:hypothetical protein HGH93_21730 [Chitinophaga polysaccharea]|uniref:hypothetical protein n=1 Tax=Chitinophaga polysaccharea TaxID=1293035 RepID=UPI0014556990|nr:hypothetical protein [Chitinophaga polysaccharea]NLR60746.1 hypothetical protein [Chitinophaga polysaccharea]
MAKVAKLVLASLMTRVIVNDSDSDEMIWKKALPRLTQNLHNDGMDNLESIENDEQCPYNPEEDQVIPISGLNTGKLTIVKGKRVIGYQVVSAADRTVIPSGLYSFQVLTQAAADIWLALDKLQPTGDWIKVPVYSGEINDPVILIATNHPNDRK